MKKRKDFELDLEEYIDEDYDENFYNENNSKDLSDEEEEYITHYDVYLSEDCPWI